MAKRTRKQKERAVTRRPSTTVVAPGAATELGDQASAAAPVTAVAGSTPTATVATRRRVERVGTAGPTAGATATTAVTRRPQRGQPAGFIQPLDSDDAAIPFDRVPYVPADLRRVAIIATLMIVLIIVADIIVSNVVK